MPKEKRKICVHVIPKYVNCIGTNAANFSRYTLRYKMEIYARKAKKAKKIQN